MFAQEEKMLVLYKTLNMRLKMSSCILENCNQNIVRVGANKIL